jgi:hypothetical protein
MVLIAGCVILNMAFEVTIKLNTSGVKNLGAWEGPHQHRHCRHEEEHWKQMMFGTKPRQALAVHWDLHIVKKHSQSLPLMTYVLERTFGFRMEDTDLLNLSSVTHNSVYACHFY